MCTLCTPNDTVLLHVTQIVQGHHSPNDLPKSHSPLRITYTFIHFHSLYHNNLQFSTPSTPTPPFSPMSSKPSGSQHSEQLRYNTVLHVVVTVNHKLIFIVAS